MELSMHKVHHHQLTLVAPPVRMIQNRRSLHHLTQTTKRKHQRTSLQLDKRRRLPHLGYTIRIRPRTSSRGIRIRSLQVEEALAGVKACLVEDVVEQAEDRIDPMVKETEVPVPSTEKLLLCMNQLMHQLTPGHILTQCMKHGDPLMLTGMKVKIMVCEGCPYQQLLVEEVEVLLGDQMDQEMVHQDHHVVAMAQAGHQVLLDPVDQDQVAQEMMTLISTPRP